MPEDINEDKLKQLYDGVSNRYELGDYNSFRTQMSDPAQRKVFYDHVSQGVDLGDYTDFETQIVKKKELSTTAGSTALPDGSGGASASSAVDALVNNPNALVSPPEDLQKKLKGDFMNNDAFNDPAKRQEYYSKLMYSGASKETVDALANYGETVSKQKDIIRQYQNLANNDPTPKNTLGLGLAYTQAGEYGQAKQAFLNTLGKKPGDTDANFGMAYALMHDADAQPDRLDFKQAITYLNDALDNYKEGQTISHKGHILANRAYAKLSLGDKDGALEDINQAMKSDEGEKSYFEIRANIYDKMGEPQKAYDDRQNAKYFGQEAPSNAGRTAMDYNDPTHVGLRSSASTIDAFEKGEGVMGFFNPLGAAMSSGMHGVSKLAEVGNDFGDMVNPNSQRYQGMELGEKIGAIGKDVLHEVAGTAEGAFSLAGAFTPGVGAFNTVTSGLRMAAPDLVDAITAPAEKVMNDYYDSKGEAPPEWLKDTASLGDVLYQAVALHLISAGGKGVETIVEKIKSKEPLDAAEKGKVQQIAKDLKPEDIEQASLENKPVNPENNKPISLPGIAGEDTEIILADGTKRKGQFAVVSANDIKASHNEQSFAPTEGFPTTKDGKTINDRDYQNDKNAQSEVIRNAQQLDHRIITDNPTEQGTPIITKDGIVVSGNGRTMMFKRAITDHPEEMEAYKEHLKKRAKVFGIDPAEIDKVKNPIIVRIDHDFPEYTTEEFARYNKTDKKEKSPVDKAIEMSKSMNDPTRENLANIAGRHELLSDFYANPKSVQEAAEILVKNKVLLTNELPKYYNESTRSFTPEGKSLFESVLLGGVLEEDAIRVLDQDGLKSTRNNIVSGIIPLLKNKTLGEEYALTGHISNAIKLQQEMNSSSIKGMHDFLTQLSLFDKDKYTPENYMTAILLNRGSKQFREAIEAYNHSASSSAKGQMDMFGESESREGILSKLLDQYKDKLSKDEQRTIETLRKRQAAGESPDAGGEGRNDKNNGDAEQLQEAKSGEPSAGTERQPQSVTNEKENLPQNAQVTQPPETAGGETAETATSPEEPAQENVLNPSEPAGTPAKEGDHGEATGTPETANQKAGAEPARKSIASVKISEYVPEGKLNELNELIQKRMKAEKPITKSGQSFKEALDEALPDKDIKDNPGAQAAKQLLQRKYKVAEEQFKINLKENLKGGDKPYIAKGGVHIPFLENTKAGNFLARNFRARGNLPEKVFGLKNSMEGRTTARLRDLQYNVADFQRQLGKEYGRRIAPETKELMNDILKGDAPISMVSDELGAELVKMRNHVDALSQEMIRNGLVEGDMVGNLEANMGYYLNRSFKVHDDPDWTKKIPQEVMNNAKGLIRDELLNSGMSTVTESNINGIINELLYNPEAPMAILKGSKLGSKDLSILKKRKDIAPEVRELMGEYKDPIVNYARSVVKMANLLEKAKFLDDVRAQGDGKFLFEKPTETHYAKIASDGSKTMAPLNGLYTTPEIAKAFDNFDLKRNFDNAALNLFVKFNNIAKYSKTVLSLQAHVRNFMGNTFFVVANGHFDVSQTGVAAKTAWTDLLNLDKTAFRERYKKYAQLGIVGESVQAGMLRDAIIESSREGKAYLSTDNVVSRLAGKLRKGAQELYRVEDDVYKIYAFENELARYKKAFPDKPLEEVEKMSADIIRNTYPTYDMAWSGLKKIRHVPVVGTFSTFPAEILRTSANIVKQTVKELKQPETRSIGAQRLAGVMLAASIPPALAAATRYFYNVSNEEDNKIRKFLAPWSKNSTILYTGLAEDGTYHYIDFGFTDPYSTLRKPLMAFFKGQDIDDAMKEFADEALNPFLGEDITMKAMLNVARNKDTDNNYPVYNPEASVMDKSQDIGAELLSPVVPGTVSSLNRLSKAYKDYTNDFGKSYKFKNEAIAMFGGIRLSDLDIPQAFRHFITDYNTDSQNSKQLFFSEYYRSGKKSDEDVVAKYTEANATLKKHFDELTDKLNAAQQLGVSDAVIKNQLERVKNGPYKLSAPSKAKLFTGNFEPIKIPADVKGELREKLKAVYQQYSTH